MQTATSETEIKSHSLSICVHHYTLRAPCPKGQGTLATPLCASCNEGQHSLPTSPTPSPLPRKRDNRSTSCTPTLAVSPDITCDSSLGDCGSGKPLLAQLATARHPPVLLQRKRKRFACKPDRALARNKDNPQLRLMQLRSTRFSQQPTTLPSSPRDDSL